MKIAIIGTGGVGGYFGGKLAQNGTVVSLGKKHGVKTPVNKYIYNCILPMELKARGLK